MDRLNSFASSAKAKAESAGTSMKSSYDNRNNSSSSNSSSAPPSRISDFPSPSRAPFRSTPSPGAPTSSSSSTQQGLFVGINETERSAFFSLLDEYFETRPYYKSLFTSAPSLFTSSQSAPIASAAPPIGAAATIRSPPPAAPTRGLGTAKALYDYTGAEKDDLSFEEGNEILVLEFVSDDWWKGSLGSGRSGLFPAAYVQMN